MSKAARHRTVKTGQSEVKNIIYRKISLRLCALLWCNIVWRERREIRRLILNIYYGQILEISEHVGKYEKWNRSEIGKFCEE